MVVHTDDYIGEGWEAAPHWAAEAVRSVSHWCVEGVRGLAVLREDIDADAVLWLPTPLMPYTVGQQRMARSRLIAFDRWLLTQPNIEVYVVVDVDVL